MRRRCVFGVLMIAAVTGAGAPHAQTSTERVWTGTWEEHYFAERHSGFTRTQTQVTYRLTEGTDATGGPRWTSRVVQWSYRSESADFNTVAVEQRPPDARGFTMHRFRQDRLTTCTSAGSMELGPSLTTDRVLVPKPEQEAQLQAACVTDATSRETGETTRTTSTGDRVGFPGIPGDTQFQGCQYAEAWRRDLAASHYEGSASVSISAPVAALMEVSRRVDDPYARFVPTPGATLTFTASVPAGTARFRFELDPDATSHFPGYATNANIDDAFRAKYELDQPPGRYTNDGSDVIFHPKHHSAQEWSRVEPLVVETAKPQGAAVVTVTTLDYGGVGRLRAFVKSEDCGDWQPVPVTFYPETREFVAIPMDEDDNLMADALEDYHGRQSGADDDAEPKGNGMAGDGLTVFEEYRGFLISGGDCGNPSVDTHVRTKPKAKDLFVHTPDPDLEMTLPHFAWSSGVDTHAICGSQYSGNPEIDWDSTSGQQAGDLGTHSTDRMRIVNFTLQIGRLREWRGHTLTQEVPQHGIYLVHRPFDDGGGRTCFDDPPRCSGTELGPPMRTSVVIVSESVTRNLGRVSTVTHELGHAVGMPHHGWKVQNWRADPIRMNQEHNENEPNVVPPGEDCVDPVGQPASTGVIGVYYHGAFVGCGALEIIVQNGENSGNAECPMRYSFGLDYREAPGTLRSDYVRSKADQILVDNQRKPLMDRFGDPKSILLRRGRYLKYDNDLDHDAFGRFCLLNKGTGLNGLPGDLNQAGDSQVACMDQLVINDNVLRGIR